MAGARHHLEAPDAIAGLKPHVGNGAQLGPAASELAVYDLLAGVDAGVDLRHQYLDTRPERRLQLIQRPNMVSMPVGQGDSLDGSTRLTSGFDQRRAGPGNRGVDESEPVVLAY